MTDVAVEPGAWVPRLGDSTIPAGHAELIRGLYRLAAWVADHPEIRAPRVRATLNAATWDWDEQCGLVDRAALALGAEPELRLGDTAYVAESAFGPIAVTAAAVRVGERDVEGNAVVAGGGAR